MQSGAFSAQGGTTKFGHGPAHGSKASLAKKSPVTAKLRPSLCEVSWTRERGVVSPPVLFSNIFGDGELKRERSVSRNGYGCAFAANRP